ncbi:hypothetical protein DCM91_04205 [Chitinophaga costaii]|nr:hypothetical protein [Chitinophaga costaii]PUZ27437.1 hypothetical protein DCM91_04205 [Chitinophaga costaii]
MKTYLRYASLLLLPLTFWACSKKDRVKTPPPIPDSATVYTAQFKFPLTRYGAGALQDSLVVIPVTNGRPHLSFTYLITSTGGLKPGQQAVQGKGLLDNNGTDTLDFTHYLQVYNDGTLTLALSFSDSTHGSTSTLKEQYGIRTYADIHGIEYDLSGNYKQLEDIAFPSLTALQNLHRYGAAIWSTFKGTYDGNGKALNNVSFYSDPNTQFGGNELGFFQYVDTFAIIKNVRLTFSADGSKSVSDGYSGGIAATSYGTIVGCTVNGIIDVSGPTISYTGGIAGANYGSILACAFNGTLNGEMTGGIAGINRGSNGRIDACYANFTTLTQVGGGISGNVLVDINHQTTIANSYANVTVSSANNFGAIRLQNNASFTAAEANLIVNCFSNISTPQPNTSLFSGLTDLTAQVTAFTLSSFPAQLTPPADGKPFKAAGTNPPVLWWQ